VSDTAVIELRQRRKRRPPARLVYLATRYALCLAWIAFAIGVSVIYPRERALAACLAVMRVYIAALAHRDFARVIAAWREGLPCRAVSRREWVSLAGETLFILVWVLLFLPGVVVPS